LAKVTLNDITGSYASVAALNALFDSIAAGFENTLSLDGTTPNSMGADIDLNSNDLLNVNSILAQYFKDSSGNLVSLADVNTLGAIVADLELLADIQDGTIATNAITTVAANSANVTTVAGISSNVTTVAGINADVTTVAGISGDVSTVATNVADVTNFADVYQGGKAIAPTLRNDGSGLQVGDLYFNTVTAQLAVYTGITWVSGTAGTLAVVNFTGDGTTVAFTLAASPESEDNTQVYVNGVYQQKNTYSISGVTLTFSEAPPIGTGNIEVVTIETLALGEGAASLTTYIPSGTGAVQTTVQEKLRESISVLDFGAIGDGVTDDTAAFQLAINAASVNHQEIFVPAGQYLITSTLNIYTGTNIIGEAGFALTASYGLTLSSEILFVPSTPSNLFQILTNPAIGVTPGFFTKVSISKLILLGDSTANSQYGIDVSRLIYSNFSQLTISGFQYAVKTYATINNRWDFCYLQGLAACIRYSDTATTDVWTQCSFWGSPVGVQTIGTTIGVRFIGCLFEQIDTYGADLVKETEGMEFVSCYAEDVPYTNVSTGCMFRVGHDGTTLVTENHLIVSGGKYQGRNAGTIGDWMSLDFSNGVIVSGVNVSRFTNVFKGTSNTRDDSIVVFGLAGISYSALYSGTAGKLTGSYPTSVINSGSNTHIGDFGALLVAGAATVGQLSFGASSMTVYEEYTAASAACTGAYIPAAVWKATRTGNEVTLTLPAINATLNTGGQLFFSFGTLLPANFRPLANMAFLVTTDDAGTRSDGVILVLTTGEIRVYKNKDTATAYTGTGGLTYSTSASWVI